MYVCMYVCVCVCVCISAALTDDLDAAVVVQLADVPGAEPAPAAGVYELLAALGLVLVVPLRHTVATDHDFTLTHTHII